MPSKFEIIDHKLDTILTLLEELLEDEDRELFGDTPFTEEDYRVTGEDIRSPLGDVQPRSRPSATRTHVEVRNPDEEGGIEMVPWSEIDERIIEVVRMSAEENEPWELWRDPTGMIRVSVEASIAHKYRKKDTYQQPAPKSPGIPQDMDIDDAARSKE